MRGEDIFRSLYLRPFSYVLVEYRTPETQVKPEPALENANAAYV